MIRKHLPARRPLVGLAFLLAAAGAALAQDVAPPAPPVSGSPATEAPAAAPPTLPSTGVPAQMPPAAPPAGTTPTPTTQDADASAAPTAPATGTGPRALDAEIPAVGTPQPTTGTVTAPATTSPGTGTTTPADGAATPGGLAPAVGTEPIPPAAAPLPSSEPVAIETGLPHDLSPWGMFMAADWVVKGVMIGLAFASLVTWTVWLAKALELAFAKRRARAAVRRLEGAQSLSQALHDGKRPLRRGPVAALARTAEAESELSGGLSADGVKERVAVSLQRIEARSGRQMARGTGLLATIGSTAPFVGLFGTVWGIMNSFVGIAESNTTNLAVVAPGIAEALLATAIGLVAAIPAVIIYNVFARSIAGYRSILSDGSAAVLRHLSRDLDRRDAGLAGSPHLARAAE